MNGKHVAVLMDIEYRLLKKYYNHQFIMEGREI